MQNRSLARPVFYLAAPLLLTALIAGVHAAIPQSGLVAAYTFNTGTPNADSTGKSPSANSKNGVTRTTNRFGVTNSAWGYNGTGAHAEVADHSNFSISTTGYLSICVWVKPVGTSLNSAGELLFSDTQGSGYVYYMGKGTVSGSSGNQEWAFRIYSADNTEDRHNRMSFYIWPYSGGLGPGAAVEETVTNGGWIHYAAVVSRSEKTIWYYKNGVLRRTASFGPGSQFPIADGDLRNGNAPFRLGTRDLTSFLKGSIDNVYVYNRKLTAAEVQDIYSDTTN